MNCSTKENLKIAACLAVAAIVISLLVLEKWHQHTECEAKGGELVQGRCIKKESILK